MRAELQLLILTLFWGSYSRRTDTHEASLCGLKLNFSLVGWFTTQQMRKVTPDDPGDQFSVKVSVCFCESCLHLTFYLRPHWIIFLFVDIVWFGFLSFRRLYTFFFFFFKFKCRHWLESCCPRAPEETWMKKLYFVNVYIVFVNKLTLFCFLNGLMGNLCSIWWIWAK